MTVVLMSRMQTSRAYEFMGVNPPSFPSIPPHENAALVLHLSMPRVKSHESSHARQKYAIWKKKMFFFLQVLCTCQLSHFKPNSLI